MRLLALLALLIGASCTEPTKADAEVAAARARWTAGRPASYQFSLVVGCFCPTEVTRKVVIVVNGTTVVSRNYADDGTPVAAQFASSFPSIDGLFDIVVDARNRRAAQSDATFDGTLGYPIQISLDYELRAADDELYFTLSDFLPR